MDYTKNNELIVEFLGAKVNPDTFFINGMYVHSKVKFLKFHTSMDLLIEVVEKIELCENGNIDVNILKNGTEIRNYSSNELLYTNVADISFKHKIEHLYQAVIWFLHWYNNKHNKI